MEIGNDFPHPELSASGSSCFRKPREPVPGKIGELAETRDSVNFTASGANIQVSHQIHQPPRSEAGLSAQGALCLTDLQKVEFSHKVLEEAELKYGFYEEKALTDYLQSLVAGIKTALLAGHPRSAVRILNTDEENAFVTLDESVYITKGLIQRLDTEEELLAVFAHEMGHAKYRHIEHEYEKNEAMQKEGVNRIVKFVIGNEYSKECEFQADSFAVEALLKMGRDPAGVRGLFGKFKEDEDKVWNEFRERLIKPDDGEAPVDQKEKEALEKKADNTVKTAKTLERFLKTHPYASERLERACIQIESDCDKSRVYSSTPKKLRLDEERFIKSLTGSFDEKLGRFNERYPDGRAGRTDEAAQLSLFKYGSMDWKVSDYNDQRASSLNIFGRIHAGTIDEFRKIFAEHKAFNGAAVTTWLSRMTDGAKDRISETARLWSIDFPGDYLAFGYPDFEDYGKNHEIYVTRTPYKGSNIDAGPVEQYKWAKRFAFRNFAKEHLYGDVKSREDLRKILDLPFMSMDTISIIPEDKFPVLANSIHDKGIYGLAKQVYKNETGKDTFDGDFVRFVADVFKGRNIGVCLLSEMNNDLDAWYKALVGSGRTVDFTRSLRMLVQRLPDKDTQKKISENLVCPVLHDLKPGDFAKSYCSIFTEESKLRDSLLAEKCIWRMSLEDMRSVLPYLSAPRRKVISRIMGSGERELSFSQMTAIFRELYPPGDVKGAYEALEVARLLSILCRKHAPNAGEVVKIFKHYVPLQKKYGLERFSYIDKLGIQKLIHPLHLRSDFGRDISKHLEAAVALLNCSQLAPGIYGVLKIADTTAVCTSDIDQVFKSLRNLKEDACMTDFEGRWGEHLGSVLDKGMELSSREHGGNFDKIFEDLKRWSGEITLSLEHSKARGLSSQLNPVIEDKMLQSLKRYGRNAGDAVEVMNTIKNRRLAAKAGRTVVDKALKIKEELELGYDKNMVMAGFTGYFLQKRSGALPTDLDKHLSFLKGLMPDPTPPRDAILRELLEREGAAPEEKLKIAGMLSDFREKTEIQSRLYDAALKGIENYGELPYREKVDIVKKYFAEPSRERDRILTGIEKKYAQSIGETKYSGSLKFDALSDDKKSESTYVRNNKYLLDPEKRAQAIAALSAGTLTKLLLRYFKGPQEGEKDASDEERKIFDTIAGLEPVDRKRIIKEMLVGLDAFEERHLKDLEIENKTGAFSIKAWKKEFINSVIENIFKDGKEGGDDDFIIWLVREIFNEANVERSADIISELVEARTGKLSNEQIMFRFLKAGGPITRKLGQILSSNSLVPESYQKELAALKLSDESPIDKEQILKIIRSELEGRVGEGIGGIHIEEFGRLLGSASIRTVYRVKINGRDYVAKINDPKAREMALEDLGMLDSLSKKLEAAPELRKKFGLENPRLLLHDLTLSLFQDIDSRIELINSRRLEQVIDQEGNHASKIYYASPNVVLEECVEGKGIHKAIEEFGLEKSTVVDRILSSYAAQIESGIFHADPHSENIMVTKTGEVYWIDKSMQGDFTLDCPGIEEKNAIFDIIFDIGVFGRVGKLHNRASKLIMKHLDAMARITPGSADTREKVKSEILKVLDDRTKGASDKFYAIEQAAEKGGYVFSDNVFMLGKSLITLSGEIKKIDPGVEIGDYLKGVFLKDMGKRAYRRVRGFFTGDGSSPRKGFLEDSGISNLGKINWQELSSRGLISQRLARLGADELKDVQCEEDAVGRLKYLFLKYGDRLTVQDIYFLMNVLKTTEALLALKGSGRKNPSSME